MEANAYSRGELIVMTNGIINDTRLREMGFELSPQYSGREVSKILRRALLVESFSRMCLIYKSTPRYIKLIERDGRDYVCISNDAFTFLSGILIMTILFLKKNNLYPCLILVESDTYISFEIVDALIKNPFRIEDVSKKQSEGSRTYIMFDKATGLYKIGRSKNVFHREATLSGGVPLIQTILVHTENIEAILHKEYATKRIRGEWFSLDQSDISQITNKYGFEKLNN